MLKVRLQPAAFLFLVFASLVAYAQTPTANTGRSELDAKSLIKEVAENYKAMPRYQFGIFKTNINQTEAYGLTSRQQSQSRYELTVDGENRFRLESTSTAEISLVISDGVTRWAYVGWRKQFTRQDANKPPAKPLQPNGIIYDPAYFAVDNRSLVSRLQKVGERMTRFVVVGQEALTVNGQTINCVILHLTNSTNNDQKVWIDTARKLVIRDWNHAHSKSGNGISEGDFVTQYDYTPFKVNEPLAAELFTFTPPEGVTEIAEFKAPEPPARVAPNLTGKDALPFALTDLKGNTVELAAHKGQVILLNFWASWCGPCLAELPHLQKLHNQFKDKGLVVLGISAEDLDIAQDFMKEKGYTFNSLVDPKRTIALQYQANLIPQTFLINRAGVIKWSALGYDAGDEVALQAAIEKLLNNEEPATPTRKAGQAQSAPNQK